MKYDVKILHHKIWHHDIWRHDIWRHDIWYHDIWRHAIWRHDVWHDHILCHDIWHHDVTLGFKHKFYSDYQCYSPHQYSVGFQPEVEITDQKIYFQNKIRRLDKKVWTLICMGWVGGNYQPPQLNSIYAFSFSMIWNDFFKRTLKVWIFPLKWKSVNQNMAL